MPPHLNGRKISVYVVDDHELIRRGLTSIINGEPDMFVCGQAAGGADSIQETTVLAPHVVIIDALDRSEGPALIAALRRQLPLTRILVLSMHDERTHARDALEAGAHGYVMKSDPFDRIVCAIRAVASGRIFVSTILADLIVGGHAVRHRRRQSLTPRESEIVGLIGTGECARSISFRLRVSRKTVAAHMENIKEALQLANGVQLVAYCVRWVKAHGNGAQPGKAHLV